MRKTITITDQMQVKAGDEAYFKDCDFGFTVIRVDREDKICPFMVIAPFNNNNYWAESALFNHATREVEEPEWPDPDDLRLHVYLGSYGRRYIYNPMGENDANPWVAEGHCTYHSRKEMEDYYHDALPLVELKLVPIEEES